MQTLVYSPRHMLAGIFLLFCCVLASFQQQGLWRIDVGTPVARVYTTELRESESVEINGTPTTFQWSTPNSIITLPPFHQPQIIWLRTIMRVEQPPQAITLTHGRQHITLLPTPGVRQYAFYAYQGTQLTISCDMHGVTKQELASICVAIDFIKGHPVNNATDWGIVAWLMALAASVVGFAWLIATPAHPWRMLPFLIVAATLLWHYPIQSMLYASQLTITLSMATVLWWVITRWATHDWQRISCHAMLVNIIIKGLGVLVPGYYGTDLFFHVHRFTAAFSGRLYQIADGQGQIYPYPPGVYQLLAPIVLPLMSFIPIERVIIGATIILDSSTILLMAWMCQRLAWSQRSIQLSAWLYVMLPAGFLMYWQAPIAQIIGQWLGMMAIVSSLWQITPVSVLWMAWAVVGHFGAFLTLHLAHTIAFVVPRLRRMAWWWWGVVIVMGGIYYSQYLHLIYAQLHQLRSDTTDIGWAARWWQLAWHYGIYGHYLGIGLALAVLGLCLAPRDRWWQMSLVMCATAGLLLLAQVVLALGATRYVIFLFPVVASYAGVTLGRLRRGHAGDVMVLIFFSFLAMYSCLAWFNGTVWGIKMGFLW